MKRVTSPYSPVPKPKQRRINGNGEEGKNLPNAGQIEMLVSGILKNVNDTRTKSLQHNSEMENKKRQIERLVAEREALKNSKVRLLEDLRRKNDALAEAKERSKETYKKVSEYKAKIKRILDCKAQLEKRIGIEAKAIDETTNAFENMTIRAQQSETATAAIRDSLKTELEKAGQKLETAETEYKNLQVHYRTAIEKRRGEWNEMTGMLEAERRKLQGLRGEIEKKRQEFESIVQEIEANKSQVHVADPIDASKQLETSLDECLEVPVETPVGTPRKTPDPAATPKKMLTPVGTPRKSPATVATPKKTPFTKHVSFKSTPIFYDEPAHSQSSQSSQSQSCAVSVPRASKTPAPLQRSAVAKPAPIIPIVSVLKGVSPKTPPNRKSTAPPMAPKSASSRAFPITSAHWSDSSDGSIVDVPRSHAILRKPPPSKRKSIPEPLDDIWG